MTHLNHLFFLLITLLLPSCVLIDKLDGLEEKPPRIYNPGTEPLTEWFSVRPTEQIQVYSADGVGISIPPNSLVDNTGSSADGYVSAILTNYVFNATQPWNMPNGFLAKNAMGVPGALTVFGASEVRFTDSDGEKLHLKPGVTGTIEIPALPNSPESLILWTYDANQERWVENGIANLNNGSYVASVSQFTLFCVGSFGNSSRCIEGLVVDGNDVPIAGTMITARLENTPGLNGGQVDTNAQGQFRIDGLVGGHNFDVVSYGQDCSDESIVAVSAQDTVCTPVDLMVLKNGPVTEEVTSNFAGSCDNHSNTGMCTDYTGVSHTADSVSAMCADFTPPATYFDSACSRLNAVALCTFNMDLVTETQRVYDKNSFSIETAQNDCTTAGGTFSPL